MHKANLAQHAVNETVHPADKMFGVMKKNGNEKGYFISGKKNTGVFWRLVKKFSPSLIEGKKILDYGCGHGRMTRHMRNFFQPMAIVAADVLSDGVDFCAKEFDTFPFVISNENPISKLNETVDVIIAVSVFSHLPRASFEANMGGLSTVLSKDGLLMFTANGEQWRENHKITLDGGFYFSNLAARAPKNEFKASDLPLHEYGQTCVSVDFVEALLKRVDLRLVDHIPQGHVGKQDIYVACH